METFYRKKTIEKYKIKCNHQQKKQNKIGKNTVKQEKKSKYD